jgi:hypothetical protein
MPYTYANIKRYNLHPVLLLQAAKQAMNNLGWDIQNESGDSIIARIPENNRDLCPTFSLHILRDSILVDCVCDSDLSLNQVIHNQKTIIQFISALDSLLEVVFQD